jgi:hypothetical protein
VALHAAWRATGVCNKLNSNKNRGDRAASRTLTALAVSLASACQSRLAAQSGLD